MSELLDISDDVMIHKILAFLPFPSVFSISHVCKVFQGYVNAESLVWKPWISRFQEVGVDFEKLERLGMLEKISNDEKGWSDKEKSVAGYKSQTLPRFIAANSFIGDEGDWIHWDKALRAVCDEHSQPTLLEIPRIRMVTYGTFDVVAESVFTVGLKMRPYETIGSSMTIYCEGSVRKFASHLDFICINRTKNLEFLKNKWNVQPTLVCVDGSSIPSIEVTIVCENSNVKPEDIEEAKRLSDRSERVRFYFQIEKVSAKGFYSELYGWNIADALRKIAEASIIFRREKGVAEPDRRELKPGKDRVASGNVDAKKLVLCKGKDEF